MEKLPKKDLKELFELEVKKNNGVCSEANPFKLIMDGIEYFIFIKNISPAYYVNSPDITRVQLPTSKRFNEILYSDNIFLILGFDLRNDVFVSWDPIKVKERLNKKRNISLFSRLHLQSDVKPNEIKEGFLSNGDKIALFKREKLNYFLVNLENFYKVETKKIPNQNSLDIDLNDFEEMKKTVKPLLSNNNVLLALKTLGDKYKNHYKYGNFEFKDWSKIINNLKNQF